MCSGCKKKAAAAEKKAAKETASFTSVEAMAARQQSAAVATQGASGLPSTKIAKLKSIVDLLTSELNSVSV